MKPMPDEIKAIGYVQVVLVLNMKRFIRGSDQDLFERMRGKKRFTTELRTRWYERISTGRIFTPLGTEPGESASAVAVSAEKVGFLTGIFRDQWFEEHYTPSYLLNKSAITFSPHLRDNFQFKKLFLEVWKNWEVMIRPTPSGMLVLTLRREYKKAKPLLAIASDVIDLQMSFDCPSALAWQRTLEADPVGQADKLQSVNELLAWLGAKQMDTINEGNQLGYAPVQWQLAMLVGRYFIQELMGEQNDYYFTVDETGEPIHLQIPDPSTSTPLHDSYVVYHIDELLAFPELIEDERPSAAQPSPKADLASAPRHQPRSHVLVRPAEIRRSPAIQHELSSLVEGALLRKPRDRTSPGERAIRFPRHKPDYMTDILQNDIASWEDELCLLTPRAAIIVPSWEARRDELLVSTLPAITSRISYGAYWLALERLIEFLLEVRVLTQVVEATSERVLEKLTDALHRYRLEVVNHNLKMETGRLAPLVNDAGNLSRLVGLCQRLSNPHAWTRAEYALGKANYLLEQVGVPILLEHSQRNVNNITDLINHMDELNLAVLSEQGNQQTNVITLGLSGLSLAIILYSLPSFWADTDALDQNVLTSDIVGMLPLLNYFGNVLAIVIIAIALVLLLVFIWRSRPATRLVGNQARTKAQQQPIHLTWLNWTGKARSTTPDRGQLPR
jgi:hypothetical protein